MCVSLPGTQLRVTYVSTTSAGNLVSGLRSLGASFEASKHAERPDFVYANAGAHIFRNRKGRSLEPSGFARSRCCQHYAPSRRTTPWPHIPVCGALRLRIAHGRGSTTSCCRS